MASANLRTARGDEGGTRRRADEVNDRPAAAQGYGSRANVELIYWTVARRADIALLALQGMTAHARTAVFRHDPRPIAPRRPVTHVLIVAALELGSPILFVVEMKTGNIFVQERVTNAELHISH